MREHASLYRFQYHSHILASVRISWLRQMHPHFSVYNHSLLRNSLISYCMMSLSHTVDHTPTTTRNVAGANAAPDRDKRLPKCVVQEFLNAQTASDATRVVGSYMATPATPLLDDMAKVIASMLKLHTPDVETADTLRKQFALALNWKIQAAIHGDEPDTEDGEYAGYNPMREAAREAICGGTIIEINAHPLI